MKRTFIILFMILILPMAVTVSAEVTQNDRLHRHPEWDGAVVQTPWLSADFSYQDWDSDAIKADVWTLGPTFIMPLLSDHSLEVGGRFDIINFDPAGADSETGLSDIDVWGKYQFINNKDYMLSAGLLLALPTGSDKILHPRASGAFNAEVFAAGRYQISPTLAAIAHVALRQNGDMDFDRGNREVTIDGEFQVAVGGGVIYEVIPKLNLQGQLNFATEAYDNFDSDIRLRFGADYEIATDFFLRGGSAVGLDDGAPDWELNGGIVYAF